MLRVTVFWKELRRLLQIELRTTSTEKLDWGYLKRRARYSPFLGVSEKLGHLKHSADRSVQIELAEIAVAEYGSKSCRELAPKRGDPGIGDVDGVVPWNGNLPSWLFI